MEEVTYKRCNDCKQTKPFSDFPRNPRRKNGARVRCDVCCAKIHAKVAKLKELAEVSLFSCRECKKTYLESEYICDPAWRSLPTDPRWEPMPPQCNACYVRQFGFRRHAAGFKAKWRAVRIALKQHALIEKIPRKRLWYKTVANALPRGLEHTITIDDIPLPDKCAYLGIQLDYRTIGEGRFPRADNAASVDRIDNELGYIPGNIQVISFLANSLKRHASILQLVAFAEGVLRVHGDDAITSLPTSPLSEKTLLLGDQ